jgi:hypothetical protein
MLLRRSALIAVGVALAVGLSAPPAHAAQTTTEPAPAAAGWLAGQLVDGQFLLFAGTEFPDPGLTVDATLAFAAAGVAGADADAAMAWLADPAVITSYVGDGELEIYAGAHAKLAFGAQVQGLDPTSFGGVDLVERLLGLQDATGRFLDTSEFGEFSNAFSQSFAILALAGAPDGTAPEPLDLAVDFQLTAQCPDGGFPEQFGTETCQSDVDSTAMVLQALLAAGEDPAAALDWLAGQQQADGSYGGNANSTGLAGQALRAGARDDAADRAVAFLTGLQVGCDGPADDRGSVPATAQEAGDAPRATAQAVLGLVGTGMAALDGTAAEAEAPVLHCDVTPSPGPSAPPSGAGGELPVTGSPVVVLLGAGAALAGAGGVTVWAARLRRR